MFLIPHPRQQWLARQLIEAGADVIWGHHPHVLQGIEDERIFYSLGDLNILTPYLSLFERTREAILVRLRLEGSRKFRVELIPIVRDLGGCPALANRREGDLILRRLMQISAPLPAGIKMGFWLAQCAPRHMLNHWVGWKYQFKSYGLRVTLPFLRWALSSSTLCYSAILLASRVKGTLSSERLRFPDQ
jgi:hypothetical protein